MRLLYFKRTLFRIYQAGLITIYLLVMGITIQANTFKHTKQASSNKEAVIDVTYCELLNTPEKFDGKLIRTNAILVVAIGPVIHSIDSFLYHPSCKIDIFTDYGFVDPPTSKMGAKLKKYFFSSKKGNQGGAEVVLVGRFLVAPKDGFGSFSSFKYKVELSRIESARKINKLPLRL